MTLQHSLHSGEIGFSCCQYFSVSVETRGGMGRSVYLLTSLNRQAVEYAYTQKHFVTLEKVYYIFVSLREVWECGCSSIWLLSVPTGVTPQK